MICPKHPDMAYEVCPSCYIERISTLEAKLKELQEEVELYRGEIECNARTIDDLENRLHYVNLQPCPQCKQAEESVIRAIASRNYECEQKELAETRVVALAKKVASAEKRSQFWKDNNDAAVKDAQAAEAKLLLYEELEQAASVEWSIKIPQGVDSGNLLSYLYGIRNALDAIKEKP